MLDLIWKVERAGSGVTSSNLLVVRSRRHQTSVDQRIGGNRRGKTQRMMRARFDQNLINARSIERRVPNTGWVYPSAPRGAVEFDEHGSETRGALVDAPRATFEPRLPTLRSQITGAGRRKRTPRISDRRIHPLFKNTESASNPRGRVRLPPWLSTRRRS